MKQHTETKQTPSEKYSPEIHRQMIEAAKAYSCVNNLGQVTVNNPQRFKAFREGQDSGYSIAMQAKVSPSPSTHGEGKFTKGEWKIAVLPKRNSLGRPQITIYNNPVGDVQNLICKVWGSDIPEAEANAALIADAPRLLKENKELKKEKTELLKTIYHEIDSECFTETENVSMTIIRGILVKHGANEPDLW